MDAGLVSSLSGALAQSRRVDKIANNLANADTPGFKSDDLAFEEALQGAHRQDDRSDIPERPYKESELFSHSGDERRVVLHGAEFTDMRQGAFRVTSNPLDLAIEGNGFFEVLTPNGIRLTRAGNLTLDAGGRLVTRDGFLVLGAGPAGQNPATTDPNKAALRALTVGPGRVNVDLEGNLYAPQERGGAQLGKLSVVRVENPAALKKEGNNLFLAPAEAFARPTVPVAANAPGVPGTAVATLDPTQRNPAAEIPQLKVNPLGSGPVRVRQGMLESSNVNPVGEMTRLIEAHRLFDQNAKLMQTVGDMNARLSDVGKF